MGWFDISIEEEGLQEAYNLLQMLQHLGTSISSVELNTIKRKPSPYEDPDVNNTDILEYLADQGRDFVSSNANDLQEMEEAFVNEVERRLGAMLSVVKMASKVARFSNKFGGARKEAASTAGAAFIKMMKVYMEQVADRIDLQDTNNPPFNSELSPEYALVKSRRTGGWIYPIGKLTGQLIDNLNSSGPAGGKIRLRKSSS
jgi:hypothetical protein